MNGKQDYDVLAFIYEYLISNFASNAGEFYTPHEVSLLMSEPVANHLMDRTKIKKYDIVIEDLMQSNVSIDSLSLAR